MAWCRLQHVDPQSNVTMLDIFGCVSEALNGTEGVSKLLPLNVQGLLDCPCFNLKEAILQPESESGEETQKKVPHQHGDQR